MQRQWGIYTAKGFTIDAAGQILPLHRSVWHINHKTPGVKTPGVLWLMYILTKGIRFHESNRIDSCYLMKFPWNKIRISGFKTMLCGVKSFYFFLCRYSESNCFLKYCKYNCHCNDCPACDTYDTE